MFNSSFGGDDFLPGGFQGQRRTGKCLSTSPSSSHNITSLSSHTGGLSHTRQVSAASLHLISYLDLSSSTAHKNRAQHVFTSVWYWLVYILTLSGTFWKYEIFWTTRRSVSLDRECGEHAHARNVYQCWIKKQTECQNQTQDLHTALIVPSRPVSLTRGITLTGLDWSEL